MFDVPLSAYIQVKVLHVDIKEVTKENLHTISQFRKVETFKVYLGLCFDKMFDFLFQLKYDFLIISFSIYEKDKWDDAPIFPST